MRIHTKCILILLVISAFLLAGCKEDVAENGVTKVVAKESETKSVDASEKEEEAPPKKVESKYTPVVSEPREGPGEVMEPEPFPEPEGPHCRDGFCNREMGESCHECEDCLCPPDHQCLDSECVPIQCEADLHCDDKNACTIDFCHSQPTGECGHDIIDACGPGDGCCPGHCTNKNDIDCGVCGNQVCEAGEKEGACPQDCTQQGPVCGNSNCDLGEDFSSCPADCDTCGNQVCDVGENNNNCPPDCSAAAYFCGDGYCTAGEDCTSCGSDCCCLNTNFTTYPGCECPSGYLLKQWGSEWMCEGD